MVCPPNLHPRTLEENVEKEHVPFSTISGRKALTMGLITSGFVGYGIYRLVEYVSQYKSLTE